MCLLHASRRHHGACVRPKLTGVRASLAMPQSARAERDLCMRRDHLQAENEHRELSSLHTKHGVN
eukprot:79986-Pleurochrysis_carterae.AAC.1